MGVEDGLTGAGAGVEHDPVAVFDDLLVEGDLTGLAQYVGGHARLGRGEEAASG